MRTEDMILVSVDDHVVEPPTLFDNHLPAKWKDAAPVSVHDDEAGIDVWTFEGNVIPNIGLNAVAGRPPEEYNIEPTSYDMIRAGCYDIHERVRDMDRNGVLGSMCFPSFVQFCGQLFSKSKDLDTSIHLLRAYNDWHIDEWCGTYPGRFIPLSIPPIWDPQLMADEVPRRSEGLPRRHVLGEPAQARLAAHLRWALGPLLRRVRGRGHGDLPAHRLVEHADRDRAGCTDRRDDHAHTAQHDAGGDRPHLEPRAAQVPEAAVRAQRGPHRVDPVLARAARLRVSAASLLDSSGLR
jgi:hypothetical protein